jgi:hypothetical protein
VVFQGPAASLDPAANLDPAPAAQWRAVQLGRSQQSDHTEPSADGTTPRLTRG